MKSLPTFDSWHVLRDRRRHQYWRAALVGLAAGALALLFQTALEYAEAFRTNLLSYLHVESPIWGFLVLPIITGLIGAFVGWMTSRFSPEAAGSGIPHVKGVLIHVNTMPWARLLPVKFFGGLLSTGAGFSLGREGPTIQMGAAVGKLIADVLKVPPKAAPRLMACGAGAGLSAAFHAPLAGFIFVIEELQREFSALTYTMALIAAVIAAIFTTTLHGTGNVFHASGFPAASLYSLPVWLIVGIASGFLGAAFNKSLLAVQRQTRERIKWPPWARAGIIGMIVGVVAWWLPEVCGGGHQIAEQILHGNFVASSTLAFLVILFIGKYFLTVLSYMAGVPGGVFAPMLVMGASIGLITGITTSTLFPSIAPIPQAFAAMGMAAFFSAIVRAPLTGIVLVLEMTGDYHQLLPLLVASMVAYLISERLRVEPLYDALLAYDLKRRQPDVPAHREPVLLEFVVQEGSQMEDKCIKDLPLPERCLLVTIARSGNDILPSGDTRLQRGDHVTAVISGGETTEAATRLLMLSKG
ncbi:MAG TPA: H(+)/Cl(-) exchange transporter ClcA [Candidatus Hydrogenedentes bacterium]|nr:H(+)/Cl(-) exchange transporter ClcA [Candidatus Hydrogenedentota bacterium]